MTRAEVKCDGADCENVAVNRVVWEDWGEHIVARYCERCTDIVAPDVEASVESLTTRDTRDEQLSDEECPFCDYAGPSPIIKEYADSYVIEPLNPVTEGHVLVIPKCHVASFGAEQWRVVEAAMSGAWLYVRDVGLPAFNIITSAGREATQTVEHLHVHVVPRREGDGLLLPWSENDRRALKDEIKTLRLELAAAENNESFVAEERKKNERLREALKDARRLADGCSQPDDCIRAIAAVSRAALASTGSEEQDKRPLAYDVDADPYEARKNR